MRRVAAAAAAYALLTLAATWPLPARLATHVPAFSHPTTHDDTLLLAWVLAWDVHRLPRDPLRLFEANLFHPLRHTLGYSEAMIAEALLLLPLAPLTRDPAVLYNLTLLSTFVLGATGAFLLVRHLTGSAPAAFVAGLAFAFAPYRFWQLDRLNALCVHLTPLVFLALHRWMEAGGRRRAALLGLAAALQGLASVYVAYATAVLVALWLAVECAAGGAAARRRALGALGALAGAAAVVAVAYAPYGVVQREMALGRDPGQLVMHAVVPAELGRAVTGVPAYLLAKLTAGLRGGGTLGVAATLLAAAGVVFGAGHARRYAALAVVALVLSFGPAVVVPWGDGAWVPGPYRLLYDWVPGFAALREPRRLTGFVVACGAVAAGGGLAAWLARARDGAARRRRLVLAAAVVALEVGWRPLALAPLPRPGARAPLYAAIAGGPAGAVIEMPLGGPREDAVATFRSASHLRPLVNGYSGFRPTAAEVRRRLRGFPRRRGVRWLQRLGVRWVVYDTTRRGARAPARLARRLGRVAPSAHVRAVEQGVALIELVPLPPSPPGLPGVPLPRAAWRARAATGDAAAVLDGDLATHWTSPVAAGGGGWLEVDFGAERELDVVRLELGGHFGEYPRAWRVLAWRDGRAEVVGARAFARAPLGSYRADHRRVTMDLRLARTRARGIRVEVPPLPRTGRPPPFDLPPDYWGWRRWGVHELSAFVATAGSGAGQARPHAEADRAALDGEAEVRVERHVEVAREIGHADVGREPVR